MTNVIRLNEASKANLRNSSDITSFTDDQRKAYFELISFINEPYNPNDWKRALVGPGGVGKTYLVRTIIKNCNISYSMIGLATPTHKACRVLRTSLGLDVNCKVNTLQSDLGLRLNFDVEKFDINNPPFNPKGKPKIEDYQLYIVDEASMINKGLSIYLERQLKENRIKLIYIGDDHQLAPVNEKFSPAFKGIKVHKLTQIVRQEEDNPLIPLLNMLRNDIDNKSYEFLNYISKVKEGFDETNTKGFRVLNGDEFNKEVITQFSDPQITINTDSVRILTYTNMCASSWNKFIREIIIKDGEKSVITNNDLITSYTTIVDEFNSIIIRNSEDYIIHDIVNYTHPTYKIKGFMIKFQAIHGGEISKPLFVLDHTDKFSVQMYMKISNSLINNAKSARKTMRASAWKEYFKFKEGCLLATNIIRSNGEALYTRDLDYGFSQTVHKSQGSTYDNVMIDVNDIVYDKNGRPYTDVVETNKRLYVALSRAKYKAFLKFG